MVNSMTIIVAGHAMEGANVILMGESLIIFILFEINIHVFIESPNIQRFRK